MVSPTSATAWTPTGSDAIHRVFHPTDFSRSSQIAFCHALKVALAYHADLTIFHTSARLGLANWGGFPGVRTTLARWGLLPPNSSKRSVGELGLRIAKIQTRALNPMKALLRYLAREPADLIVLTTYQRKGLNRLLAQAVAEPLARASRTMTLFLPAQRTGFVTLTDGSLSLRRVLVPICNDPCPDPVLARFAAFGQALGVSGLYVQLLHVGSEASAPAVHHPSGSEGWSWNRSLRTGEIVEEILSMALAIKPDLIVMGTKGHKTWLDVFRGSTTERIVRDAPCPVLAVPDLS